MQTKLTDMAHRYGQMERSITDSGRTTTWMVSDFINMQTRFATTDSLIPIKSKDSVSTLGPMDVDMRDGGARANSMDTERIRTRTV